MRERLIEFLDCVGRDYDDYCDECREGSGMSPMESFEEYAADYLLSKGVIVPPCKVGGKVYTLSRGKIKEWKACFIGVNTMGEIKLHLADKDFVNMIEAWNYNIGKTVFLTKEEAESALERSRE